VLSRTEPIHFPPQLQTHFGPPAVLCCSSLTQSSVHGLCTSNLQCIIINIVITVLNLTATYTTR